jgi:hypothetical protein
MSNERARTYISVSTAVRCTGMSRIEVLRCVERGLVRMPLRETDLAELRRVRRLQELGVNLQGIEIIHRMRHRIAFLESTLARSQSDAAGVSWTRLSGSSLLLLPDARAKSRGTRRDSR